MSDEFYWGYEYSWWVDRKVMPDGTTKLLRTICVPDTPAGKSCPVCLGPMGLDFLFPAYKIPPIGGRVGPYSITPKFYCETQQRHGTCYAFHFRRPVSYATATVRHEN